MSKYELCEEVYTVDEYRIRIEKHKVFSIHIKRGRFIDGRDKVISYGLDAANTIRSEEELFTKEEAQLELLNRVKQRHAGDIAQVKRVAESL